MLSNGPILGPEFVYLPALSQPTVHHPLSQLRSAGLIRQKRTNDGMLYSFRADTAQTLIARLAKFLGVD